MENNNDFITREKLATDLFSTEEELNDAVAFGKELAKLVHDTPNLTKLDIVNLIDASKFQTKVKLWLCYTLAVSIQELNNPVVQFLGKIFNKPDNDEK